MILLSLKSKQINAFSTFFDLKYLLLSLYMIACRGESLCSFENNFEPLKNLFVLKHKTNNYRDIKLYGSVAYKFHPLIIKFKDGWYASIQQLKTFEQALQQ